MEDKKNIIERVKLLVGDESIKGFARHSGVSDGTIRRLLSGEFTDKTIETIAVKNNINPEWLFYGKGEQVTGADLGTAEPTTDLKQIRDEKQLQDKTDRFLREKFKEKCHSFLDQHGIYDFIAENYGEDFDGMKQFIEELHASHASYRVWIEEKKQERLDHQTRLQNKLSVNSDD